MCSQLAAPRSGHSGPGPSGSARLPTTPLARRLCQQYGLDPLGTIASGALLATCPAADVEPLLQLWQGLDWPAAVIGQIRPTADGLTATTAGQPIPFPAFAVDEITKLFV